MKKHDYVRSNLTYWLDDKIQSQGYNFLQKIPRKQAVFVSLLVHKYLSENYDGHLEDITAKEADWLYKWLLLKQHADNMGLDITPYKHIFKKIVELQPEASIETIWNIYTTIAAVNDANKHTSSSLQHQIHPSHMKIVWTYQMKMCQLIQKTLQKHYPTPPLMKAKIILIRITKI